MQSIMVEPLSLIDNSTIATQKPINDQNPCDESTESLASVGDSSFRRIEFQLARNQFNGFTNGVEDGGFRVELLNPTTTSSEYTHGHQKWVRSDGVGGGYSGKERDASETAKGLDQELSVGITFRRIGAGLENLGNTCFLNSVLQCLTYTEPLAAYLQSGKHQVTCRKSGFCALCAIQKHVSRALQLSGRSLAPKDLVSNLHCISRTFRNSRQEDAHEYMVNLLESMHKCCLPNGVPIESQSAYDKSLVHKIFGGQLRSQVKCMQCNYCSNKYDPFLDLSLEILKADTLYKALANFTAKEQLDGGAKQYQCQQCNQKVRALKQLTVYKAPNVLTVHLKRFGCHMSGQKIDKKVHFGPTLDLKPFVTGPYDGDLKYTLYGVLVHAGWSTHSGHYYCFVRTSSGMWYILDDNQVIQVSEKKVFEQKAYMLFYFKDKKSFPSKKTTDVRQKEKIAVNGATNGRGAPREAQNKTGPSNQPVNAQTSLKNTADVANQKENIVMIGTPGEAQMNTGLSNGNRTLNAHTSLATVGTERRLSSSVAPKEIQTKTILGNESLNDHKSLVYGSTPNESGAPKEAQIKTAPSDGSSDAQNSLAAVGIEGNRYSLIATEETQSNSNLSSNGSLSNQKCSAVAGTMIKGSSTGASEPEHTQMKETSVPKSILEPSKTEVHTKEIGAGKSFGGSSGSEDYVEEASALKTSSSLPEKGSSMEEKALGGKTHNTELSDLPQKESSLEKNGFCEKTSIMGLSDLPKMESCIDKKAFMGKPRKKVCSFFKCKLISMKFSSNVLMGASLNPRKKKKHKRNKPVKNLGQENLVNEGSSSLVNIEAQETAKPVDNRFKERVDGDDAVLATNDSNSGNHLNSDESNQLKICRSLSQKELVHMLTRGIDRTIPRWDEDESRQSHTFRETQHDLTIGYIGDEWDEEYDRGKRKKVKISKTEFDGKNIYQDIANERLKLHSEKQNSSKMPPTKTKRKNKHFKKARAGNGPYRISC